MIQKLDKRRKNIIFAAAINIHEPMKALLIILFLALTMSAKGKEVNDTVKTTYVATVLDAESDEALAMVGVYVSNDNTTLTNFEGEFAIFLNARKNTRESGFVKCEKVKIYAPDHDFDKRREKCGSRYAGRIKRSPILL